MASRPTPEHPRGQVFRQRNRRGPAKLCTRTFPPPAGHTTRTRTQQADFQGRIACARARGARERFTRSPEGITWQNATPGTTGMETAAEAMTSFLAIEAFVPKATKKLAR